MIDEEQAKVVQEVAKATGKAIEAVREAGRFIKEIFGEPLLEYGRAKLDRAKLYRYKNILKILDEVNEIRRQREIEGKPIPISPRYAIPILQKASLEDEEEIQKLWAGLIANATDPTKRLEVKKIFMEILSNLEPLDALVLKTLKGATDSDEHTFVWLGAITGEPLDKLLISVQNLSRLGCVRDERPMLVGDMDRWTTGIRVEEPGTEFHVTLLGRSLLEACED